MALDTKQYATTVEGRGGAPITTYAPDTTLGYLNSTIDSIPGLSDLINQEGRGWNEILTNAMNDPVGYSENNLLTALQGGNQDQINANLQFLNQQGLSTNQIQTDVQNLNTQYQQNASSSGGGFFGNLGSILSNPTTLLELAAAAAIPGAAASLAPEIATTLGVSTGVATSIASGTLSAATAVASGAPIDKAIESAAIGAVAPSVGNAVSNASGLTGTMGSVDSAVSDLISSTGLNAPTQSAIDNALGKTAVTAGIDLATNKDPTNAVDAGIGSLVGSTVGANVDTGSQGLNNLIGKTAGAVTTADLSGADANTAAAKAIIGGGISSLTSPSADTSSSNTQAPVPQPDTTTNSGKPADVPVLPASNDNTESQTQAPANPTVAYVDTQGNAFDSQGNNLGKATDLGYISGTDGNGQSIYLSSSGNIVPVQGETQPTAITPPLSNTTTVTQPDNTPVAQIDNTPPVTQPDTTNQNNTNTQIPQPDLSSNPDLQEPTTPPNITPPSISYVDSKGEAFDSKGNNLGSAVDLGLIHGTDENGQTTYLDSSGNAIPVQGETQDTAQTPPADQSTQQSDTSEQTLAPGVYPDGTGKGFTDIDGNPVTSDGTPLYYDVNGNLLYGDGTLYQQSDEYTPSPEDGTYTTPDGSSGSGSAIGSAIGSALTGALNKNTGAGAAALGLGAVAANLLKNTPGSAGQAQGLQSLNNSSLDWNSATPNAPQGGVSYGQKMLNPTYTAHAKEGGAVSHLSHGGDVHREIFNGLKHHGHPIDPATIEKIVHLSNLGAPPHHVIGFLNHQRKMASGGSLGMYSDGGHFLKGPGDGMSDDIPARIGGHQEARLANEEFVIPADVVSHLGNGSSEAGAKVLYKMMDKIRHARTGTTKQGKQIDPEKFMPN